MIGSIYINYVYTILYISIIVFYIILQIMLWRYVIVNIREKKIKRSKNINFKINLVSIYKKIIKWIKK